jgi:perosamine synthetase
MWSRRRLDIGFLDLAYGLMTCILPSNRRTAAANVERFWSDQDDVLVCLSVRSGFDLFLASLELPQDSEVLMSALTIPDMGKIVRKYGLIPIPIDLDVESMTALPELFESAVGPHSKILLPTHLFGGRCSIEPLLEIARRRGLIVVEDCAQAFDGGEYKGSPEVDVIMFSFGPIKSSTALGGGILRVRDREILVKMRAVQAEQPVQTRIAYARRLLKYAFLVALSRCICFTLLAWVCRIGRRDLSQLLNGSVRGFAGPQFFTRIRRSPSGPLLRLMLRRLRCCNKKQATKQLKLSKILVEHLNGKAFCPGVATPHHTHWAFPVMTNDPNGLFERLAASGFDATRAESLGVIPPPEDRPSIEAKKAAYALESMIFLPLYPAMSERAVEKMADVVIRHMEGQEEESI